MDEHATFVDSQWGWRQRLRAKLFPIQPCAFPDAPGTWTGAVVCRTQIYLDWRDRLRVLITGMAVLETKIVTEHEVGDTATATAFYVTPWWD